MARFDHTLIGETVSTAAEWLQAGACVAIPTETVYGLAANALNTDAVADIFEIKNRPSFDPLIVHVGEIEAVFKYVTAFPPPLRKLAEQFWPGPLTLLLPRNELIPDLVTSGLPRVGIRMPQHTATLNLLRQLPFPLAAPSANPFGYISPTTAQHVYNQLHGRIPYILDGGSCPVGIESTIVGMEDEKVVVYRLGGLAVEQIEAVCGPVEIHLNQSSNPAAPGMLKSHYAPRKPLYINNIEKNIKKYAAQKMGLITFGPFTPNQPVSQHIVLSETKNLKEAAQRLFGALREMDALDIDLILAETVPDNNIGRAINDRLKRAAAHD